MCSSKQVTIMCSAWHLQLWWEEDRFLLCTACLVVTLILGRFLQHAEGVLDIQQAHENRTLVTCWCVCMFSVLHMPHRCRQRGRKDLSPVSLTCPPVICTQRRTCALASWVHEQNQAVCLTEKNLAQYGAVWGSALSAPPAKKKVEERGGGQGLVGVTQ